MEISLGLIALGILLLIAGGETLLRGAVGLATLWRLTPAVIGLTVVAAGTSVPELAVSALAAAHGKVDIAVANVIGSNIFNIAVILGLCALLKPIPITGNTIKLEYPALLITTLLCLVLAREGVIDRVDAALLLATYLLFTAFLVRLVRHQITVAEATVIKEQVTNLTPPHPTPKGWVSMVLVAVGVLLLTGGAQAMVTGAVELARFWGWSERVIGLTIVSAGTGLPEVVASLVSLYRGRSDVAVGNVIGSNIFNILGVLGLSGIIQPLPVHKALINFDGLWMLGLTLLLFPLIYTGKRINRVEACVLLAVYGVYLGKLLRNPG